MTEYLIAAFGVFAGALVVGLAWWQATKHPEPERPIPRLASSLEFRFNGSARWVYLDGDKFPFYVLSDSTVEWNEDMDCTIVTLRIPIDSEWADDRP